MTLLRMPARGLLLGSMLVAGCSNSSPRGPVRPATADTDVAGTGDARPADGHTDGDGSGGGAGDDTGPAGDPATAPGEPGGDPGADPGLAGADGDDPVCVAPQGGIGDAAPAIQGCIDAAPDDGVVALVPGTYLLGAQLLLTRPVTLTTVGRVGQAACDGSPTTCALLRPLPGFRATRGLVRALTTHDVTVDHLVLDGDRAARLASESAAQCAAGNNGEGFNSAFSDCSHCRFTANVSMHALCGTGLEYRGDDAVIEANLFLDNGDSTHQGMWSDGLTVHASDRASIRGNTLKNSTDVGLIVGGARTAVIRDNVIVQERAHAFAGLMLDNFNGGTHGDFSGTEVTANTVNCGAEACDFGINLGPHAWYRSLNILGGKVHHNVVLAAHQGINVDGAGTVAAALELWANSITGSGALMPEPCGNPGLSLLNIAPDAVVDRHGETDPVATTYSWHGYCPGPSYLAQPSCGQAGGNTCEATVSTCVGHRRLESGDCPVCCSTVDGGAPSCGAAGGNTCDNGALDLCLGATILSSYDCVFCCAL